MSAAVPTKGGRPSGDRTSGAPAAAALPVTQPAFAARPSSWRVEVCSEVGGRPRQEDRYDVRPLVSLPNGHEAAFFGVWDGTVCQHASDYVHKVCADHHFASAGFKRFAGLVGGQGAGTAGSAATGSNGGASGGGGGGDPGSVAAALAAAVREGYAATDADLLESCRRLSNHYTSSTSVTCLCGGGLLTVGHLGDSRAYLVTQGKGGAVRGVQLTGDHKPDDPEERRRIEASGGSIQLLHHHNNKPFIRGGDFDRRKASGERVMQLQYSRAFGGKDLKPFGLSAEPGVGQVVLAAGHAGLILASDGVCDVGDANTCAAIVSSAWDKGEDAAAALVRWALGERARVGIGADNITAIVIKFEP